jgi:hypothetical protein
MRLEIMVVEDTGTEELFLARKDLRTIDEGYQELNVDAPEWIYDRISEIDFEINTRVRSELQRRLKKAKARRAALATADEKRMILDEEIKQLEGKIQQ